jgi:hypothetical protein
MLSLNPWRTFESSRSCHVHIHASSTRNGWHSYVIAYVGGRQIHLALHFKIQPAKTFCLLSIEVELNHILQAQHHRVRTLALLRLLSTLRRNDVPFDLRITKETVQHTGFALVITDKQDTVQ